MRSSITPSTKVLSAATLIVALGAISTPALAKNETPYVTGDTHGFFDILLTGPIKAARALGGMGAWFVTLPVTIPSGTEPQMADDLIYDALRDIVQAPPQTSRTQKFKDISR